MVNTETVRTEAAAGPAGQPAAAADPALHPAIENPILSVEGLSLWYGEKQALNDISLEIPARQITAFIGPSGCGKSTLLRCINRMNDLIDGVRIEGDIRSRATASTTRGTTSTCCASASAWCSRSRTRSPNRSTRTSPTAAASRASTASATLDEIVERSLHGAALWDEVKDRLHDSALGLSGGQQQRLCIARAIAVEPEVILIDEPCSALDPIATARIEELMHDLKAQYTLVIVTHNMQQAARVSDLHRLPLPGRVDRVRPHRQALHQPGQKADRGLHHRAVRVGRKQRSKGPGGGAWNRR